MPRALPSPENTKLRTSISLPARLMAAANIYRHAHPEANFDDFSALIAQALTEYLERHHPGLLAAAVAALRKHPKNYNAAETELILGLYPKQRDDVEAFAAEGEKPPTTETDEKIAASLSRVKSRSSGRAKGGGSGGSSREAR